MPRAGFDNARWIERERPTVSAVIFLPNTANGLDVLGFAASQIGFIDRDENTRTALVQAEHFIPVGSVTRQFAIRDMSVTPVIVECLKCEILRR
jgi:hypothetical protein